jgi:hypothetical protein
MWHGDRPNDAEHDCLDENGGLEVHRQQVEQLASSHHLPAAGERQQKIHAPAESSRAGQIRTQVDEFGRANCLLVVVWLVHHQDDVDELE